MGLRAEVVFPARNLAHSQPKEVTSSSATSQFSCGAAVGPPARRKRYGLPAGGGATAVDRRLAAHFSQKRSESKGSVRVRSNGYLRGVGGGNFTPRPNPKPDVQVSLHPAFQTALIVERSVLGRTPSQSLAAGYASDVAGTVSTIFFGPLPHSSRTLPINEPFRCPMTR